MTHLAKHVFFPRTCLNVLIWFKYFIPLTCLNVSVQYRKQIYRLHCNTSHFGLSHDKWRENFKIFEIEKRMNRTTHTFGIGRNGDLILDRCCPQYPVKRPSLPFPEIWKKKLKKIWTLWNVRLPGAIFIPKIVNFGQKFDQNYHFWSYLDESVKKHE